MSLMPIPVVADKGSWSYLGVMASGGTALVLPTLENGDLGVILSAGSWVGSPTLDPISDYAYTPTPPAGWTLLTGYGAVSVSPPSSNGWRTPSGSQGLVCARALTAAMSGQAVSGFIGACQLLLFRNSQRRTPNLQLFPEVEGSFPSQAVAFSNGGASILAGYAMVGGSPGFGTLDGAAWPNTYSGPASGYLTQFAFEIQKPGRTKTMANAVSAYHRPIFAAL